MKDLTVQQLAEKLNELVERGCGNYEIHLDIKDHYNTTALATISNNLNSNVGRSYFINNGSNTVWISAHLEDDVFTGKHSKITYRK